MRRPRARILAMKDPGVTRGGPVGRRLLATGLQAGAARTAAGARRCVATACAAAEARAVRAVADGCPAQDPAVPSRPCVPPPELVGIPAATAMTSPPSVS